PPPPPPPPAVIELQLVEDDVVIENEVEIKESEADQSSFVDIVIKEEVIAENEIFTIVENMPSFPGGEEAL
ncbi:MAG: energy transducer TonB, partial [Bacteroidota bacterium]|nr:energy transducer TonB [Bacteroidota bacterium]